MKFKNLWLKLQEIDEINITVKILAFTFLEIELDWSAKKASFTILNLNFSNKYN
jgi:hypothetical protein